MQQSTSRINGRAYVVNFMTLDNLIFAYLINPQGPRPWGMPVPSQGDAGDRI